MNSFEKGITPVDLFFGTNVLLFVWMCREVYYDRFIHYRGSDYLVEFFVYALIILGVIVAAWKLLRHHPVPVWMLAMIQVGIVMHFAGGLALWQSSRLYDAVFFNIRYDKYVHFVNAFICGWVLNFLYIGSLCSARWIRDLQQVIGVLGLGAAVEIVEYLVTLTVVSNGVGGYDNNMQDMIANFSGSVSCVLVIRVRDKMSAITTLTDVRAKERWLS
jgi:hypothetical protein